MKKRHRFRGWTEVKIFPERKSGDEERKTPQKGYMQEKSSQKWMQNRPEFAIIRPFSPSFGDGEK